MEVARARRTLAAEGGGVQVWVWWWWGWGGCQQHPLELVDEVVVAGHQILLLLYPSYPSCTLYPPPPPIMCSHSLKLVLEVVVPRNQILLLLFCLRQGREPLHHGSLGSSSLFGRHPVLSHKLHQACTHCQYHDDKVS